MLGTDVEQRFHAARRIARAPTTAPSPWCRAPRRADRRPLSATGNAGRESRASNSSKRSSKGVEMLYGRLPTMRRSGRSSGARSRRSTSASMTCRPGKRCRSNATRSRSISTTVTSSEAATRWRVSAPSPGPISSTRIVARIRESFAPSLRGWLRFRENAGRSDACGRWFTSARASRRARSRQRSCRRRRRRARRDRAPCRDRPTCARSASPSVTLTALPKPTCFSTGNP